MLGCDWSKRITWPDMPQLKLGNIRWNAPSDIPEFWNLASTSINVFIKNLSNTREHLAVVTEDETFLFVHGAVLKNIEKRAFHAANNKLFTVNISPAHCKNIWRIINTLAPFATKMCPSICPKTLSAPRGYQFSSSFVLENCSLHGLRMSANRYPCIISHHREALVHLFRWWFYFLTRMKMATWRVETNCHAKYVERRRWCNRLVVQREVAMQAWLCPCFLKRLNAIYWNSGIP